MSIKKNKKTSEKASKELSISEWAGVGTRVTFSLFVALTLVLVAGLSIVATTHKNRFAFNELQVLRDQANGLEVEWGQLLIEQSTFGVEG